MEIIGNKTIFLSLALGLMAAIYGLAQFKNHCFKNRGWLFAISHFCLLVFLGTGTMFAVQGNLRLKPFAWGFFAAFLASYWVFFELGRDTEESQIPVRKFSGLVKAPILSLLLVLLGYQKFGHYLVSWILVIFTMAMFWRVYSFRYQFRLNFRYTAFGCGCLLLAFLLFLIPVRYLWLEIVESIFFSLSLWYFCQGLNFTMVRIFSMRKLLND